MKEKAIGITPSKSKSAIGNSKIGGFPDLAPNVSWPIYAGYKKPYAFLAQIRMEDLTTYDVKSLLPKKGMLYLFVYVHSSGSYPGHGEDQYPLGKAIYYDGDLKILKPSKAPKEVEKFVLGETVMGFSSKNNSVCKIFGKPDPQQDEPWDEWAERYLLKRTGKKSLNDIEVSDMAGLEPGFTQLFQLNMESAEEAGWNLNAKWAHVGALYFGINTKDLKEKNFEHVLLTYQYS